LEKKTTQCQTPLHGVAVVFVHLVGRQHAIASCLLKRLTKGTLGATLLLVLNFLTMRILGKLRFCFCRRVNSCPTLPASGKHGKPLSSTSGKDSSQHF
jgi:hypothetical protein